jgi:hypothetical protein
MARVREWSDEEVGRLVKLYTSSKPFDEILMEFPSRTSNAVRLKASRMGLRRPTLPLNLVFAERLRYRSLDEEDATGFIIKCSECGTWIQVEGGGEGICRTIRCGECGAIYEVLVDF